MTTRSSTSSSTILLIVILALTFPLWIGLGAGLFGLIIGLIGGAFGIVAGIFGVLIHLITLPFRILFGWGHGAWFPHFHSSGIIVVGVIVLIALLVRKKRQ